jgi:predicted nucleotidyltransferase
MKNTYLVTMNLREAIRSKPLEFVRLCKSYDVQTLYAFGSSITDTFKEESSDIDLLIKLSTEDPAQRGENMMNLWDQLELFFQRKVDLLSETSIRNPILKKSIDATKILVYDGTELQVSF